MNFSAIFIKKPVMTVLIAIGILLFGVATYFKLPISDLPEVASPVITLTAIWPGASPATMAADVASPLENQCMQIPGLSSIISTNTEGQTQITLTFDLNTSVDLAAPDVQAAISRAASTLPKDLPQPPQYTKNNPSDKPVIYILVKSEVMTPGQVYDVANKTIGQKISMIEGVSQVEIWGAQTAIRVRVNPDKLAAFDISLNEVASTLQTGTVTVPGGSLNGKYATFSIQPQGELTEAEDYDQLIIKYKNNAPVRIRDVGKAYKELQNNDINTVYYSIASKKFAKGSTTLAVLRRSGSNTVEVVGKIKKLLEDLKPSIPGSVQTEILYDRSVTIIDSINDVKFTLLLAFVLVVLVIFLFLGRISDTVIPAVTLPLSIVSTFIVMFMCGFSLDNLSLMALTLAVGFVVDDAIVVLENTVRLIETGKKPFEAATESAKEIAGTVMSMTLALVTVFIPLVFMGGIVGRTFREFALTVIAAVVCSGLISLTVTPMMCARMLKPASDKSKKTILQRFADKLINSIIVKYGTMLKFVLKHKALSLIVWLGCLVGSCVLLFAVPKSFLPVGDSGVIIGGLLVPLGTSTEQMRKFQEETDKILKDDPNVDHFLTVTGLQQGADQTTGVVVIMLKPQKERNPIEEVTQNLRKKFYETTFPLGFVFVQPNPVLQISTGGENTAQGAKYSYTITGSDRESVYKCGIDIEKRMSRIPGVTGLQNTVKLDMPELRAEILRDRASTYGISAYDIEYALSLAFAQGKCTQYITDIDQYYVVLELENKDRKRPIDLSRIWLRSSLSGEKVPLKNLVNLKKTTGPQNVPHSQQMNCATISFNLVPGTPLGDVTDAINKISSEMFPAGINGAFEGEAQEFQEAISSMPYLIAIAIFLMYVILGILYESYIHPFTVLTTLPVAAFGGLLTLLAFNSELSLYADVGMFMLLGIVAKNGIMMVDFANQIMAEKGKNSSDAIYEACLVRFRPILMTGLAAIMGAMPIAIGIGADGASRRPLGLVVVGGLIFAQVITLFVTPGIFLYMEWLQEHVLDRFELSRSEAARNKMKILEAKLTHAE